MKLHTRLLPSCLAAALPLLLLCSCVEKDKKTETPPPAAASETPQHRTVVEPALLPNRFRQTGYMINEEKDTGTSLSGSNAAALDGLQLKVGANITTTQPIPLREAMKAIVKTKNMSLSWSPDVDQELLVDIDATANDNFYEAIDNILRQLDYFHEVEGSTLVIKYRETKRYHVAMPFIKQDYKSFTGTDSGSSVSSSDNKFDIWENIQKNIDSLISTWSASVATPEAQTTAVPEQKEEKKGAATADKKKSDEEEAVAPAPLSRRVSSTDSTYTIDKPVGLITVHAPKSLQKRISDYLATLEKELYKQILIEAKIIEVQLNDSSSLGVNWNMLLQGLSLDGIRYGKMKTYNRDSGEDSGTTSSADFSDTTTDTTSQANSRLSNQDSSNSSSSDGTNSQLSDSAVNNTGTNTNTGTVTNSTGTTNTNTGTNTTTGVTTGVNSSNNTLSGALNSGFSDATLSGESSMNSSGRSTVRSLTDALSMGTTAATFITSSGGMAEAVSTGVTLAGFNFTSFIKALQNQGQTSILSNPKISVMNGQPALISVGRNVTYIKSIATTQTEGGGLASTVTTADILSGIGLALSAVVKQDNEIVMNLVPITSELSEPIEYVEVGQGNKIGLPVVNKREMSTTVKIKDGSMLVVGGLISEVDTKSGEFLPGAKNIPYLKYLFGYEETQKKKRELIILLRPRIIN
ncbi:MAG: type II and III secretion system protein [Candidatus Electronema aureum]|uniref:Type II and III secretion system protein n=1 Tax=Candidatus Electronema aureum TaxID=2005002 RepID=A0A521G3K8_9BACT|nr:MAG: type II and III secretion system protein [Candidatus Electronema aureum]